MKIEVSYKEFSVMYGKFDTDIIFEYVACVGFFMNSELSKEEVLYDEIPMSEMTFDEDNGRYTYPCPCGDLFEIYLEDLEDGEDIAYCPSCSLKIKILNITI